MIGSLRPNTRVQRTRSSPSALRSPLTRHPLGPAGPITGAWVSVALGLLIAVNVAAVEAPPLYVIGMTLDPSVLSQAGIPVDELKSEAAALLKEAGLPAMVSDSMPDDAPRLSIAVPAQHARGDGVGVFLLLQYQIPIKEPKSGRTLWATEWSRWWGAETDKAALRAELRRVLKVSIAEFVAWKKGGA